MKDKKHSDIALYTGIEQSLVKVRGGIESSLLPNSKTILSSLDKEIISKASLKKIIFYRIAKKSVKKTLDSHISMAAIVDANTGHEFSLRVRDYIDIYEGISSQNVYQPTRQVENRSYTDMLNDVAADIIAEQMAKVNNHLTPLNLERGRYYRAIQNKDEIDEAIDSYMLSCNIVNVEIFKMLGIYNQYDKFEEIHAKVNAKTKEKLGF